VDFTRALTAVSNFLDRRGQPFAVIGGISMAAYGMVRTTLDLDLVTPAAAQEDLIEFLEADGYDTLHRSSGYSNHIHPDPEMGRIDVVYVGGDTARQVFSNLRIVDGPADLRIPVPRPEHLAAMKIFAIKNDPERRLAELEDIRFLLSLDDIDRDEVRGYFARYGLEELRDDIE
jgi:hypothetical protein